MFKKTIALFLIFAAICTATDPNIWKEETSRGSVPLGRGSATAVYVHPHIYTFFGFYENITGAGVGQSVNVFYNDVYMVHPNSGKWYEIETSGSPKPAPRAFACGALVDGPGKHNQYIIIWGGARYDFSVFPPEFVPMNDTWKFDLSDYSWTLLSTNEGPSARAGAACAQVGNNLIVHGGFHLNPNTFAITNFNDMYSFDPLTNTWTSLSQSGDVPQARHFHSLLYWEEEDKLISFAGQFANPDFSFTFFLEVHEYDLNTGVWDAHDDVNLTAALGIPRLSMGATIVEDNRLIIHSGDIQVGGTPFLLDNTIIYNLNTHTVSDITSSLVNPGPAIKRSSSVVNKNGKKMYVLFGYYYDHVNDVQTFHTDISVYKIDNEFSSP